MTFAQRHTRAPSVNMNAGDLKMFPDTRNDEMKSPFGNTWMLALICSFAALLACTEPPPPGTGGSGGFGNNTDANTNSPSGSVETGRIEGFFVDFEGDPFSPGYVMLRELPPEDSADWGTTTTPEGYFWLGEIPEGTYDLDVFDISENRERFEGPDQVEVEANQTTFLTFFESEDVDVAPQTWETPREDEFAGLDLTVVTEDDESPVAHYSVGLGADDIEQQRVFAATTGTGGTASLRGIIPDEYTVMLPGYESDRTIELSAGDIESVTLQTKAESDDECDEDEELVLYDGQEMCALPCADEDDCGDGEQCADGFCLPADD